MNRRWEVDVPEGRSGPWSVQKYWVALGETLTLTELLGGARAIVPGWYTRLVRDGADVWMSDTPSEFGDHEAVLNAKGRVLIHGLGLGILPNWLLQDPDVTHVDIVEIDPDVIQLVQPWLTHKWGGGRVSVYRGDALRFSWPPEKRWDTIWSDFWVSIDLRNLPEMEQIMALYAGRATVHECWGMSDILDRLRR